MLTKRLGTWWIKNVMETAIVTPGGLPNVSSTVIQHTRNLPRDVWCSSFLYCWGVSEEVAVIKTDIWRIDSEIHASRWIDINCTKTDPPPPPAYYRPGKHILRYSTQHSSCCYRSMRAKGESFAKYIKKKKKTAWMSVREDILFMREHRNPGASSAVFETLEGGLELYRHLM